MAGRFVTTCSKVLQQSRLEVDYHLRPTVNGSDLITAFEDSYQISAFDSGSPLVFPPAAVGCSRASYAPLGRDMHRLLKIIKIRAKESAGPSGKGTHCATASTTVGVVQTRTLCQQCCQ